jgi:hypothetical protein
MRQSRSLVSLFTLALCTPLLAQDFGRRPYQELQFRAGGFVPGGDTDFWHETEAVFTSDSSDFEDLTFGVTLLTAVNDHVEVGIDLDWYGDSVASAYHDFEDSAGFPIVHDATLQIVPMMVDLRILPGGRHVARGAAHPAQSLKPVAYLGGGIGTNWWSYEEVGDFIDFGLDPPEIFFDRFRDDGFAFAAQALAGIEMPLGRTCTALVEGRYTWSSADLSGDFAGLGTLDLGGFALYAGVGFVF